MLDSQPIGGGKPLKKEIGEGEEAEESSQDQVNY